MGSWKTRKNAKKGKGSQTPGSKKGASCQATAIEKWMARASRSYKDPRYSQWCKIKNGVHVTRTMN